MHHFDDDTVRALREDLALALRAAAHHGLGEGVCNHFSVALPGDDAHFLINPQGLHWSELSADDIVLVDATGAVVAGRHAIEATAMFIHAAVHRLCRKACVLHTHQPHATSLALTAARRLDTRLSQSAMRFHGRVAVDAAYNGLALDWAEGERIARALAVDDGFADVAFLGNHGVIVCGKRIAWAFDDLYYLERACQAEILARASGHPVAPVDDALAARVAAQTLADRTQSTLFFEALRRMLPAR